MSADVDGILKENAERLKKFGGRDQYSGKGIEGHTEKVVIDGYPIRTQWLTKEVAENALFQIAVRCGSIAKMQRCFEQTYGDSLSPQEIIDELTMRRCERDPSFAFAVCFQITDKKSGEVIPFLLNYAQHILLAKLEEMRLQGVPISLVLLKARQWGGSTLVQLYMAWIQLFVRDGWNSLILAQTKDTARRIKGMYTLAIENFPYFVFHQDSLKFAPFEGSGADSVIVTKKGEKLKRSVVTVASYENYESTRGAFIAMMHGSEVAYWRTTPTKSAESLITNVDGGMDKVALNVQVLESTARGMSGFFYDEYQLAKKGLSSRQALFIPFFYLEKNMRPFKNAYEKRKFAQQLYDNRFDTIAPDETHESGAYLWELWIKGATLEHINWYIKDREGKHSHEAEASEAPSDDYECFAYSGGRVFSMEWVISQQNEYQSIPIWAGDIRLWGGHIKLAERRSVGGGQLKIWKHPDKLQTVHQYLVIVDVGGRTEKADYSVITVINRWGLRVKMKRVSDERLAVSEEPDEEKRHLPLEAVARWRGHLRYDLMAMKAVAVATYYKNALLVFESNTFDKKKAEANDYVEQGDHIRGILNVVRDKYKNLYMRTVKDSEDVQGEDVKKVGFQTNKKTKQDMVDNFIATWEDGGFIDHDEEFYVEAGIYEQRPDGSYGNIEGKDNHDDVLMTDMIGCLVSNEMPMPRLANDKEGQPVVI